MTDQLTCKHKFKKEKGDNEWRCKKCHVVFLITPKIVEHYCLNQIMEGDYQCKVCNP